PYSVRRKARRETDGTTSDGAHSAHPARGGNVHDICVARIQNDRGDRTAVERGTSIRGSVLDTKRSRRYPEYSVAIHTRASRNTRICGEMRPCVATII